MKKIFISLFISVFTLSAWTQVPEKMSYQAIVRNNENELIKNTQVGMKVSLVQDSINGRTFYSERHYPITDANGLISLAFGGGTGFYNIDWSAGSYFVKTEIDPEGGTNYTITAISEMLSVPFALHAKKAGDISGSLPETDPKFQASVAAGLTEEDVEYWNNKQSRLGGGKGIQLIGDVVLLQPSDFTDETANPLARNYPNDENIDSDPAVIFASGFENGFENWDSYNTNVSEIIADPDSAFSGNKVLKTTATRDVNTGGDVKYNITPEQDKIYLRFYTKLDKNAIIPHHFVKIQAITPGFWPNAGQKPPGDKAFWTGIEPLRNFTWNFYTYWHEMHSWQSWSGEPDGRPNPYYGNVFRVPDQEPFEMGEWICVEAMVKANTPGLHDGEQAFWIDGEKIGHWRNGEPLGQWRGDKFVINYGDNPQPFEGFNWRTTEDVKINSIILRWYISAEHMEARAKQDSNSVFFDNVVISKKYIGPMYNQEGPVLDKNP